MCSWSNFSCWQLFSLLWFHAPRCEKKNTRPMSDLAKPVGTYRWLDNPLGFPRSWKVVLPNRGNWWKSLQFGKELILVGRFSQPMWKVCNRQNGFILFNFLGEKRTYLKSPTSDRWRFHQDRFETTKGVGQKFPEISGSSQLKCIGSRQVLSESWASPKSMQVKKLLLEMSSTCHM